MRLSLVVRKIAVKLLAGSAAPNALTQAGSATSGLTQGHVVVCTGLLTAWLPPPREKECPRW